MFDSKSSRPTAAVADARRIVSRQAITSLARRKPVAGVLQFFTMLFRSHQYDAIGRRELTCAFRRWTRPTVRTGGTLITPVGVLAIDEVVAIDDNAVTDADARAAGHADAAALLADLAQVERQLYRITFHVAGQDPRLALRADADLDEAVVSSMRSKLDRLDARSPAGPWTTLVLTLIAANPARRAGDLADAVGMERLVFKTRVRSLKAMGLTESLEVGYRIAPRGEALLRHLPPREAPTLG
jgi:hypothetical protein